MNPLVSVSITAYQHAAFIRQAIESVLVQETTFPFEILLGEDGSTDGTREICKEYAAKYPDVIRLFLHDRSQVIFIDGKPTGRFNLLHNMSQAKGKYMALLDGDDFWKDPHKLQEQVDLMELHQDWSFCFHDLILVDTNGQDLQTDILPDAMKRELNYEELAAAYYPCPPTSTILYRRSALPEIPPYFKTSRNLDILLTIQLSKNGNGGYLPGKRSAYRRHAGGIWSGQTRLYKAQNNIRIRKHVIQEFQPSVVQHHIEVIIDNYLLILKLLLAKVQIGQLVKNSGQLFQFLFRYPYGWTHLMRRLLGGKQAMR